MFGVSSRSRTEGGVAAGLVRVTKTIRAPIFASVTAATLAILTYRPGPTASLFIALHLI